MPEVQNLPSSGSPAHPMEGSRSVRPVERALIVARSYDRSESGLPSTTFTGASDTGRLQRS
jgi:hypothetical protein